MQSSTRILWSSFALWVLLLATPAQANDAELCDAPYETMDKYRYLRSLSLDLRGNLPTMEEYAQLDQQDNVPAATITAMLESDAFESRYLRWQKQRIWHNVSNFDLQDGQGTIAQRNGIYWSNARSIPYRGARVPCLNTPAETNPAGDYITEEVDGAQLEGYVEVEPYWAPGTTVKVCAFEARDNPVGESGALCNSADGFRDTTCGCGPNLIWCAPGSVERQVRDAFGESLDRLLASQLREGQSYEELFTSARTFINGPLVHFWKHWTRVTRSARGAPEPLLVDFLPDLSFTDTETWVEVQLPNYHAGILTSPAFLMRHQTNRGRADQFYAQFMCQPFNPPTGPLPFADAEAQTEPDLQLRAGCKYCHAALEPSAAYWGRWREAGPGYLGIDDFPMLNDDCHQCAVTGGACPDVCDDFYITAPTIDGNSQYLGLLNAYLYTRPEHEVNIERGPGLLAMQGFATNAITNCTVKTAAEMLLGRPLLEDEQPYIDAVVTEFGASGYDYREIIRALVTSPIYRRLR